LGDEFDAGYKGSSLNLAPLDDVVGFFSNIGVAICLMLV